MMLGEPLRQTETNERYEVNARSDHRTQVAHTHTHTHTMQSGWRCATVIDSANIRFCAFSVEFHKHVKVAAL